MFQQDLKNIIVHDILTALIKIKNSPITPLQKHKTIFNFLCCLTVICKYLFYLIVIMV